MKTKEYKWPYGMMRALSLAVVSTVIMSAVMAIGTIDPETHEMETTAHLPFMVGMNLMLFVVLYIYNFQMLGRGLRGWKAVVVCIIGSLLLSVILTVPGWWIEGWLYAEQFNNMMVTIAMNGTTALVAALISLLLESVRLSEESQLERERLEKEVLRVRHEALERQVSPHFLFNSLNALDALIGTDEEGAHKYVQELASIYRYVLQKGSEVTLSEEMEFTREYVEMMRTRYGGDALIMEERVAEDWLGRRVPRISVQMLVENAVKHNVATKRRPLTVVVESETDGVGQRWLTVSNVKAPRDGNHAASGVGLSNLGERCRLLTGREPEIVDDGERFTVRVPV